MRRELPAQSLLSLFEAIPARARRPCLLGGRGEEGFQDTLAWDPVAVLEGHCSAESDPRRELERFVADHTARGRLCVGYCSYELGRHLQGLPPRPAAKPGLPDYSWLAYDRWLARAGEVWTLCASDERFPTELATAHALAAGKAAASPPLFEPIVFQSTLSPDEYGVAYRRIAEYIRAGDIYQVNLTYQMHGQSCVGGRGLFPFVARSNPVEHLAYLEGDGYSIHSASPERFARVRQRAIETVPIKGTRPRGALPEQDRAQLAELLDSEKEAAELHMITDLLRNDLAEVCLPGSVQVVESRVARAGPKVWHTASRIQGLLRDGVEPFAAVLSMLPAGSISGCPKRRALQIIDELERGARGVYTGIIGRIDPDGDADFSVAIRTLVQAGNDVYLSVGGGIVHDSVLEREHAETVLKATSFANLPACLK
ncbi:MAG: anthranilate synthase component I family protein [Deltaproteobacteria bacterium]